MAAFSPAAFFSLAAFSPAAFFSLAAFSLVAFSLAAFSLAALFLAALPLPSAFSSLAPGAAGGRITTPPAFSTAATAVFDAPATSMVSLALISPLANSLTPSKDLLIKPAVRKAVSSTGFLASSLPASMAFCRRPRLTSAYVLRNRLWNPRLGRRLYSGIWPPSNPASETPLRDFWPLWPRPDVPPLPEPAPRPNRLRRGRAPAVSRSSFSRMSRSPLTPNAPNAPQ